jgi:hypothetical protein
MVVEGGMVSTPQILMEGKEVTITGNLQDSKRKEVMITGNLQDSKWPVFQSFKVSQRILNMRVWKSLDSVRF